MKNFRRLTKNRDFWVVVAVIAFGFYTGFFTDLVNPPAYLEIDFGERKRAFSGEITDDMSVLDALVASSRAGDFDLRYAILNDQVNLMVIDGFVKDGLDSKNWNFRLNGESVETPLIHKQRINPGDRVLIKYE